jgi:hypothetical protein
MDRTKEARELKKILNAKGGKATPPRRVDIGPAEDRTPNYKKDSYTGKPLPYLRKK